MIIIQGVTVEQLEKTGEMVRSICQPKFKISDEEALNYRKGIFGQTKDSKCYVNCIFENMQSMKRGKFQVDSSKKQADLLLPDDIKGPTIDAMEACRGCTDGIKDHCDAAFVLLECLLKNNKNFFFP